MEALNVCVALDRRLLGAGDKNPPREELEQFVDAHKHLADAFQDSNGDEIRLMDIDSTQKLQLENERQLMPVFISQSEFGLITYMTTFRASGCQRRTASRCTAPSTCETRSACMNSSTSISGAIRPRRAAAESGQRVSRIL